MFKYIQTRMSKLITKQTTPTELEPVTWPGQISLSYLILKLPMQKMIFTLMLWTSGPRLIM